eukprot:6788464-Karenia_brevis.AAC.1
MEEDEDTFFRSKRGGWRQKKELLSASPEISQFAKVLKEIDSLHARHLITEWACSAISATQLQVAAYKHYMDAKILLENMKNDASLRLGADFNCLARIPRSLVALAKLGDWGTLPGNCKRDLLTYLGDCEMPKAASYM